MASIVQRKGLYVLDDTNLDGAAGDMVNDDLYIIGDELENRGKLDSANAWTGDQTFSGNITYSDTFWDDLRFPVSSLKAQGSKTPGWATFITDGAGSQGVATYFFDKTTEEELFFTAQMPHSWKEGTDIHPHIHWSPIAGGAGVVSWGLEYTWADIGGVFGNTTIIALGISTPADNPLIAYKHYLTDLGDITGTGYTFSSHLLCRVFRDATGTYNTDSFDDDAAILEIDFHYEIDTIGTQQEYAN